MNEPYKVKLDTFEGPLDLLLHLINKYEIDIYDIPVAEITSQYMAYIHTMQQLELNIASEYLVMAATLLEMKSKLLLPHQEVEWEEEYEEDPREELMRRLIEYRKYKEAAHQLKERELEQNQVHTRSPIPFEDTNQAKVPENEANIYDMLDAINRIMERKKWNRPLETSVQRTEIPIEQRMDDIMDEVLAKPEGVSFYQLFPQPTRSYMVATFVAILELMKQRKIQCIQAYHFDDLMVYQMEVDQEYA
ncbi:segregation and condensation protein A [Gracilibacillus halophilus YIM-C55.5]|uniref:Segregation and condensation protein A n=1 Tax=Gracilibacillus halophilus YIM-C55.5 TaxID=1308866 RepID=N4WMH0_9BACI|nr:segregation/condensation protein A [Gracilibacillus halophilus]ENH97382.1 segregation and condensation protein A [Gracilibacillus halophilus YIM-C55.5]